MTEIINNKYDDMTFKNEDNDYYPIINKKNKLVIFNENKLKNEINDGIVITLRNSGYSHKYEYTSTEHNKEIMKHCIYYTLYIECQEIFTQIKEHVNVNSFQLETIKTYGKNYKYPKLINYRNEQYTVNDKTLKQILEFSNYRLLFVVDKISIVDNIAKIHIRLSKINVDEFNQNTFTHTESKEYLDNVLSYEKHFKKHSNKPIEKTSLFSKLFRA
jgi:hypothetical protein